MSGRSIADSLLQEVRSFDLAAAARRHITIRTEFDPRQATATTTVEIVETAQLSLRAFSSLPGRGQWDSLRAVLESFARTLTPETWPAVLVEVEGDPAAWLAGAGGAGFPVADGSTDLARQFAPYGGFSGGLSLARFGLVSLFLPPSQELLSWLSDQPGVRNLWHGREIVRLPEPELSDQLWDGHDLVLGKENGRYPDWFELRRAGRGVRLAVLDTGVSARHQAFSGRINDEDRVDFTGSGHDDQNGHGTHCAGIAAGGVYGGGRFHGIAPAAQILAVKVLSDSGSGQTEWILRGLEWAVRRRAQVISMSLGSTTPSDGRSPLSRALQYVVEREGIFVAVSAGNSGPGRETITVPADAKDACAVGAVDRDGYVAAFSSRGPSRHLDEAARQKPDLCAPGDGVVGPAAPESRLNPGGRPDAVASLKGTSMAAPFVAGAAAVLISASASRPSPQEIKQRLFDAVVEARGDRGGQRLPDRCVTGAGILCLDRAMRSRTRLLGGTLRRPGVAATVVLLGILAGAFLGRDQIRGWLDDPDTSLAQQTDLLLVEKPQADPGPDPETPEAVSGLRGGAAAGSRAQRRAGCYEFDPAGEFLRLRVSRGATLTGLAQHFRTGVANLRNVDPALDRGLLAGRFYSFPVGHLRLVWHHVRPGDTIGDLAWVYQAPSKLSVRTWNCLPSDSLRLGDTLLFLAPASSAIVSAPTRPPDRSRAGAYQLWSGEEVLQLTASPGLTLRDLAVHMRTDLETASRACRRRGKSLRVGDRCVFSINGLSPRFHAVRPGETSEGLARQYSLPSRYSVGVWNNLPAASLRAGDELLLLLPSAAKTQDRRESAPSAAALGTARADPRAKAK